MGKASRMERYLWSSLLLLMFAGTVFVVRGCWIVNDRIDKCMDQTSGHYIYDDRLRAEECSNPP
jgi:hypothetical protein